MISEIERKEAWGTVRSQEKRRSRRRSMPGVLVALEAPARSQDACWAGTAFDINGDGVGLALPPEVEVGDEVLMTFRLADTQFRRLPGKVLRRDEAFGVGAIGFGSWPDADRMELLSYLLDH